MDDVDPRLATAARVPSPRRPEVAAVGVVVPAHDEEQLVGRCLTSLVASVVELHETRPEVEVVVVVVLDRCTDGTAGVVAAHASYGVVGVPVDVGGVGAARRAGVAQVAHLLAGHDPERVLVLNTDADCVVPPTWVGDHLRLAGGADLVQGWVAPDPADLTVEQLQRWRAHNPVDRGSLHGANLGVRLHAYLAVGGFDEVQEHEDLLLVRALGAAGFTAVSGTTVLTSGRQQGRVPGGFSGYLRALADLSDLAPSDP